MKNTAVPSFVAYPAGNFGENFRINISENDYAMKVNHKIKLI